MNYLRTSPLHDAFSAVQPVWDEAHGMRIASRVGGKDAAIEVLALADLSCLPKAGLKGPLAAQWLKAQGVPVPPEANTWAALPGDGVIARLGRSEFFLEDGASGGMAARAGSALGSGVEGVYPVIRQDCGILLAGPRSNELLVQTCNVNFAEIDAAKGIAVMTQMIGVGVLVIRTNLRQLPCYRIWCDPTFAQYFWATLSEIVAELGGGAIGTETLLK
jgi:sarcosine oxidase subunit gamma